MKNKILVLISLLLVLGLGIILGYSLSLNNLSKKDNHTLSVQQEVTLMIDQGNDTILSISENLKENETLFSLTKRVLEGKNIDFEYKEFSGLGVLVEKIGDKENGEDNKYWQYWKNGQYGEVGADSLQLKTNDIVLWKFAGSQK